MTLVLVHHYGLRVRGVFPALPLRHDGSCARVPEITHIPSSWTASASSLTRGTLDLLILKALTWGQARICGWLNGSTRLRSRDADRRGDVVPGAAPTEQTGVS